MYMKKLATATAMAVVLSATGAVAAPLSIENVTGVWQNAVANPLGGTISGVGGSAISWGTPSGQPDQSGYTFEGAAPPAFMANEGVDFVLGEFVHQNNPITGTSLASVDLEVTVTVGGVGDITSVFSFEHTETSNGSDPCADGGDNGVGVNVNGCADLVQATLNVGMSETFEIDGVEYIFDISGFQVAGDPFGDFWTVEGLDNAADLVGSFVTKTSVVPLPAGMLLMGTALAGFGVLRRRKKTA